MSTRNYLFEFEDLSWLPFFKPIKWSTNFFVFLIPLCTIWDGIVLMIRFYDLYQLQKIASEINADYYTWKSGKLKSNYGLSVNFLIGYPKNKITT